MSRRAFIGEDFLVILESQLASGRGPTREEFERLEVFEILEAFQDLWTSCPTWATRTIGA